jgi:DNA repair exonuclease SbcCD ATPase subunit
MELTKITSKPVVYSLFAGLLVSLLFTGLFLNQKNNLAEELAAERMQTQSLTQSKEVLQKDIVDLEARIIDLKEAEEQYALNEKIKQSQIDELNQKALRFQAESNKTKKQTTTLKNLEKELAKLKEEKNRSSQVWSAEKERYQASIAELEKEKQSLINQLSSQKTVAADYFRIDALKKKGNKQIRKASRTKRILVSFSWNESLTKQFSNSPIYLSLTGPGTSNLPSNAFEKVAITMGNEVIEIPVVAKAKIQSVKKGRQEIIMTTKTKLLPGVYQADVYTDQFHLGGAQIKLD